MKIWLEQEERRPEKSHVQVNHLQLHVTTVVKVINKYLKDRKERPQYLDWVALP